MFRSAPLLLVCLALPLLLAGAAKAGPAIVVNGVAVVSPRPAVDRLGVVLLPLRPVLKALGAQAEWRPKEQKLHVRRGERLVELWIGTPVAQVDRVPVQLDVPPLLVDGTTYVPLRVLAQAFQAIVRWDVRSKTITIRTPPPACAKRRGNTCRRSTSETSSDCSEGTVTACRGPGKLRNSNPTCRSRREPR